MNNSQFGSEHGPYEGEVIEWLEELAEAQKQRELIENNLRLGVKAPDHAVLDHPDTADEGQ